MKSHLAEMLVIACVLLLASCSPQQSSSTEQTDWSLRWLTGIPCRAPCFEGVTPGESTAQDALRIWRSSNTMRNVRLGPDFGGTAKVGDVVWSWPSGEDGGSGTFWVQGDQTIDVIDMRLRRIARLGDAIAFYGDPTHVAAHAVCVPDSRGASLTLFVVFKRNSFALSAEMEFTPESTNRMLDSEATFTYVRFYAPDADIRVPQMYGYGGDPSLLEPWRGPQPVSSYLRDYTGGRCFVPTPTPQ